MCRNHASYTSVNFGTSHKSCCVFCHILKVLASYLVWSMFILNTSNTLIEQSITCTMKNLPLTFTHFMGCHFWYCKTTTFANGSWFLIEYRLFNLWHLQTTWFLLNALLECPIVLSCILTNCSIGCNYETYFIWTRSSLQLSQRKALFYK